MSISTCPRPQARWPELVQLIENYLSHQRPVLPPDPDLLARAERLSEVLCAHGFAQPAPPPPGSDLATFHLDTLAHSRACSGGGERLALAARLATAWGVARRLHPSSEREAHAWPSQARTTLELLGLEGARPLARSKLDRTGGLLWRHRDALEAALFQREWTLLHLPPTLVFYDLTHVHYYGCPRSDLQHGRSKQKRNDCPLMTLALALDGAGFPRRSEILPGNVSEPGTLEHALRRLEELPAKRARARQWGWTRGCQRRRIRPG